MQTESCILSFLISLKQFLMITLAKGLKAILFCLMNPEELEQIFRKILDENTKSNLTAKIIALRCLSPGRPNPTFRSDRIVPNCK